MSIDIFGRVLNQYEGLKEIYKGSPGVGFDLTTDGHFNINNKRLTNIGPAVVSSDATNLQMVQELTKNLYERLDNIEGTLNVLKTSLATSEKVLNEDLEKVINQKGKYTIIDIEKK